MQKERILVVDDEPRLLESVRKILMATGYEVVTAGNGGEAMGLLDQGGFSAVLLDIHMPGVSGQEVLNFIVSREIRTSVIILSGESTFSQASEAMRKGAQDFLAKPCPPDKLLATVARVVEKRRSSLNYLQVQQRLQKSEELHRFIVNESPDLIFMLDAQGRFSYVNDRSEFFLGCPAEEVLGRHFSEFVFEDDQLDFRRAFHRPEADQRSKMGVELRLCSRGGENLRYVEIWTVPVVLTAMGVYGISRDSSEPFVGKYGIVRDIGERKQTEELRRFHLFHDHLTGLPNRLLFHDRLQLAIRQAKRLQQKLAVMFLDIDRFKRINDSLGHIAGDELLQIVARKLKSCLREGDTLARISGDEFNLVLPNISSLEDASVIARKIRESFDEPLQVQGQKARITFSIGFAVYPDHGDNKDALVRYADTALYRVKETGRNGFLCFSEEMRQSNCHYLDMENSLHRALQNDELQLHYQPQIDMKTRKVVGLEALVRWAHPQRGLLLPAEFLPVAEQSTLICSLGEWVLKRVCRDACTLREIGHAGIPMALNVSPQHLEMDGFARGFIDTVRRHELDPALLEIEITENCLLQDMEKTMQTLSSLAREGITITVDDFGRGYSSLSYLQTLPLHTIKIDRSFVHNLNHLQANDTIINAILTITKGLNLKFIAEGVESAFQHEYLVGMGCSVAQGFFYSYPLPFTDLVAFLGDSSVH